VTDLVETNEEAPLKLTATGPGSRAEIAAYIQQVIEERTTPNDDTSAERLAHGITTSVLHRLGAGYTVAVGGIQTVVAAVTHRVFRVYVSGLVGLAVVGMEQPLTTIGLMIGLTIMFAVRGGRRD